MVIFWDFNGTILDDLDLCYDILNKMLKEDGKKPISKERYLEIFTFPIIEYYKAAGFDFKRKNFEQLAIDFINLYQDASLELKLHKGLVKAVKHYKSLGYKNVVLSASRQDLLESQLEHYKIDNIFDKILGTKDIYAKTKIDVALEYIKENNLENTSKMMIGDTLHDAEVAEAINAKVILYTKGHQSKQRLAKYQTIDTFHQLIKKGE